MPRDLITETPALADQLAGAMRNSAQGVSIITAHVDGEDYAMAATAVSSVSMDPPSMLICVNESASLHPVLTVGETFCINILPEGAGKEVKACSGAAERRERFEVGDWDHSSVAPRLRTALASIDCRIEKVMQYGTHGIFIGRVTGVTRAKEGRPMVYHDRMFKTAVCAA